MTKKTGFFVLFIFVFITGTAHGWKDGLDLWGGDDPTWDSPEEEQRFVRINKLLSQMKQQTKTDDKKTEKELRKEALKEASRMYFDSPCGAETRAHDKKT